MFHTSIIQSIRPLLLALTITFFFAACKSGDPGPQGDPGATGATGATGPAGPTGATGNANVIQISYGSRTHSGGEISYATGMSATQLSSCAFYTYVNPGNNMWYFLPGTTAGGTREYRTYVNPASGNLLVNRISGTGSETFTATRAVFVPANDLRNGRKAAVDFSNYQEVKNYYNLPD